MNKECCVTAKDLIRSLSQALRQLVWSRHREYWKTSFKASTFVDDVNDYTNNNCLVNNNFLTAVLSFLCSGSWSNICQWPASVSYFSTQFTWVCSASCWVLSSTDNAKVSSFFFFFFCCFCVVDWSATLIYPTMAFSISHLSSCLPFFFVQEGFLGGFDYYDRPLSSLFHVVKRV